MRFFLPFRGLFGQFDPLLAKNRSLMIMPYALVNPAVLVDPLGLEVVGSNQFSSNISDIKDADIGRLQLDVEISFNPPDDCCCDEIGFIQFVRYLINGQNIRPPWLLSGKMADNGLFVDNPAPQSLTTPKQKRTDLSKHPAYGYDNGGRFGTFWGVQGSCYSDTPAELYDRVSLPLDPEGKYPALYSLFLDFATCAVCLDSDSPDVGLIYGCLFWGAEKKPYGQLGREDFGVSTPITTLERQPPSNFKEALSKHSSMGQLDIWRSSTSSKKCCK